MPGMPGMLVHLHRYLRWGARTTILSAYCRNTDPECNESHPRLGQYRTGAQQARTPSRAALNALTGQFSRTRQAVSVSWLIVCNYINFCAESVIPRKQVKIILNNKPWVTKPMKDVLFRKRRAFRKGDKEQLKSVQKELKWVIRRGREEYKTKLESHFEENNMGRVWEGLNLIGGGCKKERAQRLNPAQLTTPMT